jgi:hypothetical protein
MAPKLNEHARSANTHDPERERYVAPPRARLSKELGRPEQRVEVRGNERPQALSISLAKASTLGLVSFITMFPDREIAPQSQRAKNRRF